MSGIYIKGMEMPKNCDSCMFSRRSIHNIDWCVLTEKDLPCDCPLVPVPPHGDLIERKAIALTDFEIVMCDGDYKEGIKMLLEKIEFAPTIIPAEDDTDFYTKGHLHLGYAEEGE